MPPFKPLLFAALVFSCAAGPAAAQDTALSGSSGWRELGYEDFERFAPGAGLEDIGPKSRGLSGGKFIAETFEGGTVTVVDIDGSKAAKIENGPGFAPGNKAKISFVADESLAAALGNARVQIEFRGRNDRAGSSASLPYVVSMRNEVAVAALFSDTSAFRFYNGGWRDSGTYSRGRWYQVKVLVDYVSKTFDYYVDGSALIKGGKFRANSPDMREIMFYIDRPNALMYVDDIRISADLAEIPEQIPPVKDAGLSVQGNRALVTIDRDYALGRLVRYLPLDIAFPETTAALIVNVGAEAAENIFSLGGRVRLYTAGFQAVLPPELFGGGGDLSFEITRSDIGALNPGPARHYTGKVYGIKASRGGTEIAVLGGNILIKESGVIDGGLDRALAVMRLLPGGGLAPANGKHDLITKGIRLEANKTGSYAALRTSFSFADLSSVRAKGQAYGQETGEYARIICGRGIMDDDGAGNFKPQGTVSRAQLTVMLAKALDLPEAAYKNTFQDLGTANPASPFVARAIAAGIVDPALYGPFFRPDEPATREDLAVLITRAYLAKSGRWLEDLDKYYDGAFTDLDSAAGKTVNYLKAAAMMGYLSEKSPGRIAPRENASRSEAAGALVIMLENLLLLDKDDGFEKIRLEDILSSPILHRSYNLYPPLTYVNAAPSGALGNVNIDFDKGKRDTWYIEEQRWVASDLMYEILRQRYVGGAGRDDDILRGSFRVFKWGFDKQRPDGFFPNNPDVYHSAYFILEALGRTLYLYKNSGDRRYGEYLDVYRDKLSRTAAWLNRDENFNLYRDSGAFITFTHRNFLLACGLLLASDVAGGNEGWEKQADQLLSYGLFRMTKEGLFPERDGFDAGYQQTSIEYLIHSYTLTGNLILKSDLREALSAASAYSMIRFDDKGNIDLSDSTRSGGQEAKRDGSAKTASERTYNNMLNKSFVLLARPDLERAIRHMGVRQGYISAAFNEYWRSGRPYNFEFDRPVLPAAPAGQAVSPAGMNELPVQSLTLSENNASATPRSLIDGNLNSAWSTRPVVYAVFDLGRQRDLGGLRVAFNDGDKKTCFYSVMVSENGLDWYYAAEDNRSGPGQWSECLFPLVKARYVKLWIGQVRPFTRANMPVSIAEVKILGR
jgi:hypothetical protein